MSQNQPAFKIGDTIVAPIGRGANRAVITDIVDGFALIDRFKLDGTPASLRSPAAGRIRLAKIPGYWPEDGDHMRVMAEWRLAGN